MLQRDCLILRQLFDRTSCTYTYLLGCEQRREAVLVDPVFAHHQRDMALIRELGLTLVAVLDTHVHADHITGAWLAREATGAKIGLARAAEGRLVDLHLEHGDQITFGACALQVRATPGHTDGCLSFVDAEERFVLTGDALMIRGTGRTDFQQGDPSHLFHSIQRELFSLPESCLVLPGHDYSGRASSTIAEEKAFNPRIGGGASEIDFVGHLQNLELPHPRHIAEAVPANLISGRPEEGVYPSIGDWAPLVLTYAGVPEVKANWVATNLTKVHLVDVREADELTGELGAIEGIQHIPLDTFKDHVEQLNTTKPIVVVCRSGRRSALAVKMFQGKRDEPIANLQGGMISWRTTRPLESPGS